MSFWFGFSALVLACGSLSAGEQRISLPTEGEISLAEVFVWRGGDGIGGMGHPFRAKIKAVLVFCPGQNGSSEPLLWRKEWQELAEREGVVLVGFQFVSSDEDLKDGRGYFVASRGSGKLLEEGLTKAGQGDLPVYLYGFSGGAHFAMSFAAWRPERVAGFCAYSFAWSSPPPEDLRSPALIVCGQADGTRYGASLAYFQAGRRQGKPWAWVSLEGLGHEPSAELDEFVRRYFSELMRFTEDNEGNKGGNRGKGDVSSLFSSLPSVQKVVVDNMTEKLGDGDRENDVGVSVLPGADLLPEWRKLHHP